MIKEAYEIVKDQMGPCGISCAACDLGNGSGAEAAKKTMDYLQNFEVSEWASMVPGGSEIDFDNLRKSLEWVHTYVRCQGCEQGGGPPDCVIRSCAREKGYDICTKCDELDGCGKFDWLGEPDALKSRLRESRGKSKQELVEEAIAKIEP